MMADIKDVDWDFVWALFDSEKVGKYEPRGKFIWSGKIKGKVTYTAIDNTTGDAWTEKFDSREMARRWLRGETVMNIHGEVTRR